MGPICDCGVQRAARKMLIRESQPPDRRLSTHRFGVVFNRDLSAACTLLFVQDIPVTQQAEAQRTSQKVSSGACDHRRNNVPGIRGRHDGLQRNGSFEYIFESSGS